MSTERRPRAFTLDPHAWDELQRLLGRPPVPKPEISALLMKPSVLEAD